MWPARTTATIKIVEEDADREDDPVATLSAVVSGAVVGKSPVAGPSESTPPYGAGEKSECEE